MNGLTWHLTCFQCSVCAASLSQHNSCFVRNNEIFCKTDYNRYNWHSARFPAFLKIFIIYLAYRVAYRVIIILSSLLYYFLIFSPSIFGIKCSRCGLQVSANHWIRRAGNDIYHLACFACFFCKRQLSTGEEFGLMENQVLCRLHYDIMLPNLQHMSDKGHFDSFLDV